MKRTIAILLAALMLLGMIPMASADVAVTGIQTAGNTRIQVGATTRWTASVIPANATNKGLYWAAGNPGVATVDQYGNITGHKAGQCNISITAANGVQKVILLTVGDVPATGINTAGRTLIAVGEVTTWTATVVPASATNKWVNWAAGNPGVATIDQNGTITAKKAGDCNITATGPNGVKKTVMIHVKDPNKEYEAAKAIAKKSGYVAATKYLEDQVIAAGISTLGEQLLSKLNDLYNDWVKAAGSPLVIETYSVTPSSVPVVNIKYRNLSGKRITTFKSQWFCYDANGKVTTDYPRLYNGGIRATGYDADMDPLEQKTVEWELNSNKKTRSIRDLKVVEISYADGTTWKR